MKTTNYKGISQLLVDRGIQPALDALLDEQAAASGSTRRHAQLLMGRFRRLEEQRIMGTIGQEDYQLEKNRIQLALMNLLSEEGEKTKTYQVWQTLFSAIIFLVCLGCGAWILSQPKAEVEVRFSQFQASRVAMQSSKVANLYLGQKVEGLSIYNFEKVMLEAGTVITNEAEQRAGSGPLHITPLPGIGSVGLHLGAVSLESLNFEDSAQIVISQVEGAPERFRIQVQQSKPFSGRLNYSGLLPLSSAYVQVEVGDESTAYYEPLEWSLQSPEEEAREIHFTGDPANFIFEFTLRDSVVEQELLVHELAFFQPEQQQVKSSILSGTLRLQEEDQPPLKTIQLREGNRIDLELANNLLLRRLSLRPEGIFLEAGGKLQSLYTYESGDRRLRNPSCFSWFWHNRQLAFAGTLLLGLGGLYFIISRMSSRLIYLFNPQKAP